VSLLDHDPFSGMMRYQLGEVNEQFQPVGGTGGKRFRPLLCLAVCAVTGGEWRGALSIATGIELLHNFSLIHDDIEDRDPTRHHRATVWRIWGEPQAINAGDGMLALANHVVAATPQEPRVAIELVRLFADTTLELTEGQYLDMSFEARQAVTPDEYMTMISLKTAALIQFSTWAGAFIAGASNVVISDMREFGAQLGLAFQIHDDIQGIWGAPEKTGKESAGDLRNRKKTLPVLLALTGADRDGREVLARYYRGESDDVEDVLGVLEAIDARQKAESVVRQHRSQALSALRRAVGPEPADEIEGLVSELTGG
jgi:geranylgeranyl diphosphate synthase type I